MIPDRPSVSIASDERARIPFAVVGVLLLLSSVAIVAALETRPDPESNIDPSLALDRAESSTQAAIKDAMLDASQDAAASPVTEEPEDGPWEDLMEPPDGLNDRQEADHVFRDYTALLVYDEVHERIDGTTHTIRENTTTEVSLDPIDSESAAADAISRVDFQVGTLSDSMQDGTVRVEVEGVEYEVRQNGEHVATRTRDVNVTVATPLFDVHQRTQLYQQRLQMNMLDGGGDFEGIGREFAARTYLLVMGKSMFNYLRAGPSRNTAPLEEVVPPEQTDVMMNHANYGVQSKVFGTRDPDWKFPMAANTLCWLDWEYERNYRFNRDIPSIPSPESIITSTINSSTASENHQTLCESLEDWFEAADTVSDTVPSLWDILTGDAPGAETMGQDTMQQEEEVNYTVFVLQADTDLTVDGESPVVYDRSGVSDENRSEISGVDMSNQRTDDSSTYQLEDIVENVYSMDLRVERASSSDPSLDADPPSPGSGYSPVGVPSTSHSDGSQDVEVVSHWESHDRSDTEPHLFTVTVEDEIVQSATQDWVKVTEDGTLRATTSDNDTGWATATFEIYGEFAPGATIDRDTDEDYPVGEHSGEVQDPFEPANGGSASPPANFDEAPENALKRAFADVDDVSSTEGDIEDAINGPQHLSADSLQATLGEPATVDTTLGPGNVTSTSRSELETVTEDVLEVGKDRVEDLGPLTFERTEFVSSNPHQAAYERLRDNYTTVVHDGSVQDPFAAMPDFLRAEALHRFQLNALHYTNKSAGQHESGVGQLTDDGGSQSSLDEGLELAEKATDRGKPSYGGFINSSDMLGNVSFQIRGSPTYLEFDEIDRDDDPTLRPADQLAHDRSFPDDIEFVPGSGCYDNRMTWFGLPLLPWPGSWYVTATSWRAEAHGEYSRFEVTANVSESSRAPSLSYVKESKPVELETDWADGTVGWVEPIEIDTWGEFPMIVPTGKAGVGDTDGQSEGASDEWAFTGPGWQDEDEDDYPQDCPP